MSTVKSEHQGRQSLMLLVSRVCNSLRRITDQYQNTYTCDWLDGPVTGEQGRHYLFRGSWVLIHPGQTFMRRTFLFVLSVCMYLFSNKICTRMYISLTSILQALLFWSQMAVCGYVPGIYLTNFITYIPT